MNTKKAMATRNREANTIPVIAPADNSSLEPDVWLSEREGVRGADLG